MYPVDGTTPRSQIKHVSVDERIIGLGHRLHYQFFGLDALYGRFSGYQTWRSGEAWSYSQTAHTI
jgi:hypothetical protein